MSDKIELTPDEIKNGWTKETLGAYLKEREKGQAEAIDMTNRTVRPEIQESYRPLRWRD
ncbi:MAG: hypothetical protein IH946_04530 [Bacteroidetes bacterium]|nr:hypothetical protein [Bacteroidota bacterium]